MRTSSRLPTVALLGLLAGCPTPPASDRPRLDSFGPSRVPGGAPFTLRGTGRGLERVRALRIGPHRLTPRATSDRLQVTAPPLPRGEYALEFDPEVEGAPPRLRVDNSPPQIRPVLRQLVRPGQRLRLPLELSDFDGDPLSLTVSPPATAAPSKDSLHFFASEDLGSALLVLTASVSDGRAVASTRVEIEVRGPATRPRIELLDPPRLPGGAASIVEVYGAGFDAEAKVELDGLPLPTEVLGATLLAAEVPAHARGRAHVAVVSGGLRSEPTPVDFDNAPPTLQVPLHTQATEGARIEIRLAATDMDGDPVRIFATDLPPGARFDPARGTVTMTPDFIQGGASYEARAIARAGARPPSSWTCWTPSGPLGPRSYPSRSAPTTCASSCPRSPTTSSTAPASRGAGSRRG